MEEARLDPVALARGGDLDAFDQLVRQHAPAAYRLAAALVGESLARELAGEAFLAAWQQLPRLHDPDRLAPWLHRIVVNRGRAMLRRGRAVREIPVSAFHESRLGGPHAPVGSGEARAVLAGALAALSYDQRAIIALHHAAGLSVRETAEALDIPASGARSRLEAALEALRRRAGVDPRAAGMDPSAPRGARAATDERMPPQDDPRVEAYLRSLGEAPVPADLAGAVTTRVRERPSRRPSLRLPALAGAAGLLLVVSLAMAAGWRPPFDLLPGPEPTSWPSTAPGPTAAPGPTTSPETVPPGDDVTFARVVTAGAELRTEPGGGELVRRLEDLETGISVLVLGRAEVDGRAWTKVELEGWDGFVAFAWLEETVASSGPTGYQVPVLQPTTWIPCPDVTTATPGQVAGLTQAERLACFGPGSISFGPVMVGADPRFADQGSPAWLAGPAGQAITSAIETGHSIVVAPLRVRPATGLDVPAGEWIRLTGHFDDVAAAGCERTGARGGAPVGDAADQVLWCRQQLVVTGWTRDVAPHAGPR
jgi:RNA polymerase sigma-70 factor (ECF subfamily)